MKDVKHDLSMFSSQQVIASFPGAWNSFYDNSMRRTRARDYSIEEIQKILDSGSIESKRTLSRNYFTKDGFYTKLLLYYATVIYYYGLLIPNPSYGKSLTLPHIQKRYAQALEYIDKIQLQDLFTRISTKVLLDGTYYGLILSLSRDELTILDLPGCYCRSRFKDIHGNDIIEFDVTYFNSILDKKNRDEALKTYPQEIQQHYKQYSNGLISNKWVQISSEIGLCFSLTEEGNPAFLNVLPAILKHETSVDNELDREKEEIRKIIVQKIPHIASNGELVFEPDEAMEMHKGAVNMLSGNKNLSVLTTYADVDAIVSKTGADTVASAIEQTRQNIYSNAGVSPQIFAPTGSQALPTSIKKDIAIMMILADKYCIFVSSIINSLFGNANVRFTYKILPVGIHNQNEYTDEALKLAQNGYSWLLPAVAFGISQNEFLHLKELENEVLQLQKSMVPLNNSYTTSGNGVEGAGRPELPLEQKSQKTIQNEDAIDNQGGA